MFFLLVIGCNLEQEIPEPVGQKDNDISLDDSPQRVIDSQPPPPPDLSTLSQAVDWEVYPFLNASEGISALSERFETPEGYTRVNVNPASFGAWLRGLPVLERTQVYSFRGRPVDAPSAGVVPMNVGFGDIQQCADSILRLYSEFLWAKNRTDDWSIHFTSGDPSSWNAWREGQRFEVDGRKVKTVQTSQKDASYEQYQKWMHHAFIYAGTKSLHLDSTKVAVDDDFQPGDFFVSPGSPGHAILILDVAVASDRPPVALLGQGFMPAQDFHVLMDSGDHMISGWFELPVKKDEFLNNPSWYGLPRTGVYRF